MTKIHLLEAAMESNISTTQFEEDIDKLLTKKPVVLGVTEADSRHKALLRLTKKHNYTVVQPKVTEEKYPEFAHRFVSGALLVSNDAEVLAEGWTPVIDPRSGRPTQGGHGPRGYTYARVLFEGERFWVAQLHLLGKGRNADQDADRAKDNERLIAKTVAHAKREGKGAKLAFLLGDSGLPSKGLDVESMTSIWAGRSTPRGDIATVLAYDTDGRVKETQVRRYSKFTSTHQPLSATYDVEPRVDKRRKADKAPDPVPILGVVSPVDDPIPGLEVDGLIPADQETAAILKEAAASPTVKKTRARKAPAKKAAAEK